MRTGIVSAWAVCLGGWLIAGSEPAVAQDVPADSAEISVIPFEDEPYVVGSSVDSTLPATGYYLDLTRSLSTSPGGFSYDLGNVGWPHHWSFAGMGPQTIELKVDDIPQRDPSTDRALFDAIPIDLLTAPRSAVFAHGGPRLVETHIRPLDERRPYTELRFMTGTGSLQSISGLHVQQRQWRILGAPTVTQFLARLAFHQWSGRYPNSGSDLSQVYGRVGFTSRRWRIRFSNSYSLRTRGAHSSVIARGTDLDSVYDVLGATVGDPNAEQRHQRNQFDVSVEHSWETGLSPLVIRTSFTKALYRYTNVDTSETKSTEFRLRVQQEAPEFIPGHTFTGRLSFESTDLSSEDLLTGGGGATKSRFLVTLDDRFRLAGIDALAAVGINTVRDWTYPSASIDLKHQFAGGFLGAAGSINGLTPSALEVVGGLGIEEAATPVSSGITRDVRISGGLFGSSLQAELTLFTSARIDPVEVVRTGDRTHRIIQMSGSQTAVGASVKLGWRAESSGGFYGSVSPTVQTLNGRFDSPDLASEQAVAPVDQLASELPDLFGSARFGYRDVLFEGDLDLDVYLLARFWSQFMSRTYDPVHAILVLPEAGARPVDASGTVDIRVEAGIRQATLWLSVENVLANLAYPGAMTVPVYPLTAQAFRFGVYWPIWG